MDNKPTSPIPTRVQEAEVLLTFYDALREVMEGKKITRLEWGSFEVYGLLKDGILHIHRDNTFFHWTISDGDMSAIDWVVIPEGN